MHQPYIAPEKNIPEFTAKALILGIILGIILGAANAYLGLYAGITVSASIPAAILSMAVLRILLPKLLKGKMRPATILESNIVQTIATSGETLAAGVIFTVPALVITQAWHQFHFWPTTLICMTGGLLGILFMIPLRRAIIVEEPELKFPEGVACAEVLKAGDEGGKKAQTIFLAIFVGGIYKFLSGGMHFLKGGAEFAWAKANAIFYFGTETSVALFSVGYIVGINIGSLVFLGGLTGWIVGIPIYTYVYGLAEGEPLALAWKIWSTQIRYIGVGAMALGGLWTIYSCRIGMKKGLQKIFGRGPRTTQQELRTDRDLPRRFMLPLLFVNSLLVLGLYYHLTQRIDISITSAVIMVIASFLFTAVASYIVGLVGSSNTPISGMTICSVLFAAAVLLLFGLKGMAGVIALLGIAGVVCCATTSASDIAQDLKTGYIVGCTPYKLQLAEVIGAIIPAFIFAPILTILHGAYGIGVPVREGVKPLVAPQAMLFSKLAEAFFLETGELPWNMFWIGMAIAAVIIFCDQILKKRKATFRLHIMAVAVGIYLPLKLAAAIFLGSLVSKFIQTKMKNKAEGLRKETEQKGVLIASGWIAGESLMGVGLAAFIFGGATLPITLGAFEGVPNSLMPVAFALMIGLFIRWVLGKKTS